MKAILCKEYGPADSLVIEDVPSPEVKGRGVKVRVKAAGLNFPDTLIIEGKYQLKPSMPFSPGGEMAGEVIEVGEKVTRFKPGDRVAGLTGYGAFAEEVVVPEQNLLPIPDSMSDEKAAAFTMVYGTSYYALKQRANLQPGESLLVLGASGGVGLATVELGKAMGARVIAAASSAEKLAIAKDAGADELINYSEEPLKEAVKNLTKGKGVDVIYDPVGGDFTEQALRAMGWNGRHLIIGFAAGEIPKVPANLTLLKGCSVVGVFWGSFTQREPEASAQNMMELMKLYAEGKIDPKISEVFEFDDYAKALGALTERRATGKVVLKVGA
ncbi:NADPH:quinone oxidoreductase family protein [Marinobacter sp. M216]|uniref:NADPH:quinone oxidoreductase family protein n=1 Tax=Marinobacter albus TaxID=3030833 RepID=A0ABT7HC25_9GAMM|nr:MULTISPECIES: NADPH:quinone oxidoreductase family protein [unclassified Marinobacter]MBW7470626.1 NADPH:quinone oxidoreductase family protein [Marinobacter sp. F4218]MDK9557106.1 NADPH:quinone oxidoreductase family protein [Marinobacter sp. M216]